jgi:hypothetical protein
MRVVSVGYLTALMLLSPIPAAQAETGCGGKDFPTLCMTVDIQGAAQLKGASTTAVLFQSCAEWADARANANGRQAISFLMSEFTPVSGVAFGLIGFVQKYAGPGTYVDKALSSEGQNFAIQIGEQRWYNHNDFSKTPAKATMTVAADGSGALTFSNFTLLNNKLDPPFPSTAGTISWTCADPKK